MREGTIDPARIHAANKAFGVDIEVSFFYNRQKQRHEFRVRWSEGRYVQPEIATRFANTLGQALQHLKDLQRRQSGGNHFLRSDFDTFELMW